MSKRTISILWKLTGLAALGLLLVTAALAMRSRSVADVEVSAYIARSSSSVYLRERVGDSAKIVTVVNPGTPVLIKNSLVVDGQEWYFIEIEDQTGWIPADNISLTPP